MKFQMIYKKVTSYLEENKKVNQFVQTILLVILALFICFADNL